MAIFINETAEESRTVDDYDLTFLNGLFLTFTVDTDLGDTVDFNTNPLVVTFHRSEKPATADPDSKTPADDTTVFLSHVLSITHRKRLIAPVTPDQKAEWRNTLLQLTKTVQ